MRRILIILSLAALIFCVGCEGDRTIAPRNESGGISDYTAAAADPEKLAEEIVDASGWSGEGQALMKGSPGCVTLVNRAELAGDIVHYSYRLTVGPGQFDEIGLHRVVREKRPCMPERARKNVFMLHGDGEGFESTFLPGAGISTLPDDFGIAVYLAGNGVDVWGMDQSWLLVPAGTTDFSFMADWDLQHEVDNLRIGLSVARAVRLLTGSGPGRMLLLGYSSGVATGYAYLNEESQYSELMRNVAGFIPVDLGFKTDDPTVKGTLAAFAANFQGMIDSGVYKYDSMFGPVGMLAATDPDGASPLVPGYTNLQVAVFLGAATHLFTPLTPTFHYLSGQFDQNGIPVGFNFAGTDTWLEFLQNSAPYEALPFMAEYAAVLGDAWELPYDDNLGDITVPVFYLGAAGGFGAYGEYTTTLLGSSDVSTLVVQLFGPGYEVADYGHIDLFLADNAEALVWTPVLDWICTHTPVPGWHGREISKAE
jgi:hypothetical protein